MAQLFIGNLDYDVEEKHLEKLFQIHFDSFISATIPKDHITGNNKPFGFVNLADDFDCQRAKDELDGYELLGKPIQVKDYIKKE